MLSKNEAKQIRLLSQKKHRSNTGLFVVEGEKAVSEFCKANWDYSAIYSTKAIDYAPYISVDQSTMTKISQFSTPSSTLGVFKIQKMNKDPYTGFSLALDSIKDPGNLGTIIRLCDWFGIEHLYCNFESVDYFNPKTVQASMGSLARVNCHFCDLEIFLKTYPNIIYGATLNGENIYNTVFSVPGLLVLGSESHGISSKITSLLNKKITIPGSFKKPHIESLNVSSAAGILLAELNRQEKI